MVTVGGKDIAAVALRLRFMPAHQAAYLLAVHQHALVAESRSPVAIALELVANRGDSLTMSSGDAPIEQRDIERRAQQPHWFAPPGGRWFL